MTVNAFLAPAKAFPPTQSQTLSRFLIHRDRPDSSGGSIAYSLDLSDALQIVDLAHGEFSRILARGVEVSRAIVGRQSPVSHLTAFSGDLP
jgi:hypothetical protein